MAARWVGLGVMLLALAPAAWAQGRQGAQGGQGGQATAGTGTSNALPQACMDLLNGRLPPGGASVADALRSACNGLMEAHAQALRQVEQGRQARAQPQPAPRPQLAPQPPPAASGAATGTGAGPGEAGGGGGSAAAEGTGVGASFAQAGRQLITNPFRASGLKGSGSPFGFTLITNPVGWFTGQGINAELFGVVPGFGKLSWLGGAQYSRATATNGTVDTVGLEVGGDYFLYGQNNEGLRLGPRLELAFGRETFATATNFGWLGLAGEVGYNFIATNGITGTLAAGFGGRVAGHKQENFASMTGGELGPYAKIGIGYSW